MVNQIVISVNPKQKELMDNIVEWCNENLNIKPETTITLLFAHCLEADLDSIALETDFASVSDYLIKEDEEALSEFNSLMTNLATQFQDNLKVSVEFKILKGVDEPYKQISEYVGENHCQLLIVGSRDLSFWQRLWSTSFSDSIIHSVHCPVIVIKPKVKEA